MNLDTHLKLRTPLVWVTTEEPGRVIDKIVENTDETVYRMDSLAGFIKWDAEQNMWVQVLLPDEEGELQPVKDPSIALDYVLNEKSTMILENAHNGAQALSGLLLSVVLQYRKAFYSDDNNEIPAQFFMLSHKDEIPGEIARMTSHVMHDLPSREELVAIVDHIGSDQIPLGSEPTLIARAALGLSETEFISAALFNFKEHGNVTAKEINKKKMDLLKQNGILEVRTPEMSIDNLGGLDNAKELIREVNWIWNNPEEAKKLHIESLRRIMFVGVPGTGKSLICEAISSVLELDLAKGGVSNAMNKYVGESESNMRRMFATLKRMAPIVFWIDEFGRDMSGGMSSGSVDGGTTDRVHGEFLTGLQELPNEVFLAAAANRIEDLPPEMTRADRFDRIMFVGFPTESERESIFKIHIGDTHEDHNLEQLAAATSFFTGAEIKALIKEVRFHIGTKHKRAPTTREIVEHVPRVKGRVWINHRAPIVAMYERAQLEWTWASTEQELEADKVLREAKNPTSHHVPGIAHYPQYAPKKKPVPQPETKKKGGFQVPDNWK